MEHIDQLDMEHFDSIGPSAGPRPYGRGSLARVGVGVLVGALASGAFFVVRDGGLSTPTAQQVKTVTPSKPYLLKFGEAPAGLCLQFASSLRDQPPLESMESAPLRLKRGDSDVVTVMVSQFGGPGPEGIVGETIDINGHRGLVSKSGGGTAVSWKHGRTSVMMNARGVTRDELFAAARSVVLAFDENGARVSSINAAGFVTEQSDPSAVRGFGFLGYGDCGVTTFSGPTKSMYLSTGPKSTMETNFGQFGASKVKETPLSITRNGSAVKAKRVEVSYDGTEENTSRSITWVEKEAGVIVGYTKVDLDAVLSSIDGLGEASLDEYAALAKTAKRPNFARPVIPGEAPQTESKELGTFKLGTAEGRVMSSTQGDKICLSLEYALGGGGDPCIGPAPEPVFTQSGGDGSNVLASVVTASSVAKAVSTFPGGKTVEIPSFQDDRVPSLRVFVLVRTRNDPVPTKITFLDAAGKVISEQTSSYVADSAATVVPVAPPLAAPTIVVPTTTA